MKITKRADELRLGDIVILPKEIVPPDAPLDYGPVEFVERSGEDIVIDVFLGQYYHDRPYGLTITMKPDEEMSLVSDS